MPVTLTPTLSPAPFNSNVAFNNSWITVDNNQNRPLFAQTVYALSPNIELTLEQILDQLRTVPNDDGFIFIDNTDTVNGNFQSIRVVADCKISELVADNSIVGNLSAYELPQGFEVRGQFSSIKLEYGAIIAYKALDSLEYINGLQSVFDSKYIINIQNGNPIVPMGG